MCRSTPSCETAACCCCSLCAASSVFAASVSVARGPTDAAAASICCADDVAIRCWLALSDDETAMTNHSTKPSAQMPKIVTRPPPIPRRARDFRRARSVTPSSWSGRAAIVSAPRLVGLEARSILFLSCAHTHINLWDPSHTHTARRDEVLHKLRLAPRHAPYCPVTPVLHSTTPRHTARCRPHRGV